MNDTLSKLPTRLLAKLESIPLTQLEAFADLSNEERTEILEGRMLKGTFQKSEFFQHRASGQIQLYLYDNFKRILATASETLNIVPVPKYETLTQTTYDKNIISKYGKDVIVQPINTVLSEMRAVIASNNATLADGYSTFWYVEFEGRVFYVSCFWIAGNREWRCNANEVDGHSHWSAGNRMASPAT